MAAKALVYLRKSKHDQQYTLKAQEQQCMLYCQFKELEVVEVISDSAVSGARPLARRENGKRLIARLAEVDAIVSSKLDRMFRDVPDCVTTVRGWQALGKTVHFLDVGIDTSTPIGELLLSLMAAIAQWERRRISERTKEALAVAKKKGIVPGPPPFGAIPREAMAAARIRELAPGRSLAGIARILNEEKVPSRHGGKWTHVQIGAVLSRRIGT